ncbi:MAG: MFS transporter [Pseudonocardiaceae bacterium]
MLPDLPRGAWVVLGADTLSAIGSGLTVPFLVVYLHDVRGLGLPLAGSAVAMVALASAVGNPAGGVLADRVGPRPTLIAGLATAAAGAVAIAGVSSGWEAFGATALSGLGVGMAWPAQDTLLARLVSVAQRTAVYAVRHATLNAGLGIGGLLAAMIVDLNRPGTFTALYWLDAASFVLAIPLLLLPSTAAGKEASLTAGQTGADGGSGYRIVLRDPIFVRVWILTAVLVAVGFAQFSSALPAFATSSGGLSAGALGIVFAVNTLIVVLAQLVVLRLLGGVRRTRALALLCLVWGGCWLVVLAGGLTQTVILFMVAAAMFGLGETLVAPTVPALVNDIAPEALRGRYNGASVLAYTAGFAIGPLLAGFSLGHGLAVPLLLCLVAACLGCAMFALRLETRLPRAVNLVPVPAGQEIPR